MKNSSSCTKAGGGGSEGPSDHDERVFQDCRAALLILAFLCSRLWLHPSCCSSMQEEKGSAGCCRQKLTCGDWMERGAGRLLSRSFAPASLIVRGRLFGRHCMLLRYDGVAVLCWSYHGNDRMGSLVSSCIFINHSSLSREGEVLGKKGTATIFPFFGRLAASARMPRSCTQHHSFSSLQFSKLLSPSSLSRSKACSVSFSYLINVPAAVPFHFTQKHH